MVEVAVYSGQQHEQFTSTTGRFVLREAAAAPGVWTFVDADSVALSELTDGLHFAVTDAEMVVDASRMTKPLCHANETEVFAGETLPLPCILRLGSTWIEVAPRSEPRPLVPLLPTDQIHFIDANAPDGNHYTGPSSETITRWLTEAGQLHRASADSPQFFADAARFAVETVGLDAAWVLARNDDRCRSTCPNVCCDEWRIVGSKIPTPENGVGFDATALEQIHQQSVSWYQPVLDQLADGQHEKAPPLDPPAVVTAPVLNREGQLIAAIYGVRNTYGKNRRRGIRPLEARLIQVLAESVGVGIARLEQETEAARTRVLLQQAFSATVVDHLQQHPECLAGQEREISLLFADLHDFTAIAEGLRHADCYALLGDVMETLTQVIMQNGGVVVDYYGDGLLAIWNAPLDQPNHPDLACAAALEMLDELPTAVDPWKSRINRPLELGIGIHTGPAQVGNAGTRYRIKYGPRGNTVNVASRVQAATKQLQLPLVLTAATQTKLSTNFFAQYTCTAKLPGLQRPTKLYTVCRASEANRLEPQRDQHEKREDTIVEILSK